MAKREIPFNLRLQRNRMIEVKKHEMYTKTS